MTADHQPSLDPAPLKSTSSSDAASPGDPSQIQAVRSAGFAGLARRVATWTSRGVVCAAILIVGLALGRQVLQWWGAERGERDIPPPQSLALGALGDAAQEHLLEFGGNRWSMSRQRVAARDEAVLEELESRCAETVGSCQATEGEPGPAERNLLDRIAGTKPTREEAGQWQLFSLGSALPMVVGTRWATAPNTPPKERVAGSSRRVVIWGLAVPAGGEVWNIYVFHAASPGKETELAVSELPIPPGGRKTLAIRAADGGAVVAFKGLDRRNEWGAFFDAWMAAHGWKVVDMWQHRGATHSIRAVRESGNSLDVLLTSDETGEMIGLMLLTPVAPQKR